MAKHVDFNDDWPPDDGRQFIKGDAFALMLLDLAQQYSRRIPHMDFSDAVAHAFLWFDQRLDKEPDFISAQRFATRGAFRRYVGQIILNSGRLAQRQMSRAQRLDEVEFLARPAGGLSPEERATVHEAVEKLEEPYRSIIERYFLGDEDLAMVVSALGYPAADAQALFIEALDRLSRR